MRNAILMGATQLKSIKNTRTHIRCKYIRTQRSLSFCLCFFSFIRYKFVMVQFSIHYFCPLAFCYKLVALHIINNYGIINICVTYFSCCLKSATWNTNRYRGQLTMLRWYDWAGSSLYLSCNLDSNAELASS